MAKSVDTFNYARTINSTDRARGDSCSSPLDEQSRLTFPNPQILESGRGLVKDMATARKTPVAATAAVLLLLLQLLRGQVARFYPRFDCKGPYITVASNARRCYPPFLYRSIRMPCLT
ncbi:unnamed protein product [Spirodela intermedia]|uniref:Uncharacterized protein n=1 Tax=Spirodela intermedia TaxID=51605 RepID=A0ABN7EC94_SPIIN|nr:unnamed protein product [Spirodela intermedia]